MRFQLSFNRTGKQPHAAHGLPVFYRSVGVQSIEGVLTANFAEFSSCRRISGRKSNVFKLF